jgi:glutathione peroxidase
MKTMILNTSLTLALSMGALACEEEETDHSNHMGGAHHSESMGATTEAGAGEDTHTGGDTQHTASAGTSTAPEAGTESNTLGGEAAGGDSGAETAGAVTEAGVEETAGATSSAGTEVDIPGGVSGGEEFIIEVPEAGTSGGAEEIDLETPGEGAHAFIMRNIDGEMVDMRRYRDKVILIVNVASMCGYTRQYEDLQNLYERYQDRGFLVLGFPANNFGNQESGTEEEIKDFCMSRFGVTFPMFAKISVKGEDIHPMFTYLTTASGREVSWNFNKFLIDGDGAFQQHFLSQTEPLDVTLTDAIEALLPPEQGEE